MTKQEIICYFEEYRSETAYDELCDKVKGKDYSTLINYPCYDSDFEFIIHPAEDHIPQSNNASIYKCRYKDGCIGYKHGPKGKLYLGIDCFNKALEDFIYYLFFWDFKYIINYSNKECKVLDHIPGYLPDNCLYILTKFIEEKK